MALSSGDPAIDKADPASSQGLDQREYFRPVDGDAVPGAVSDIGAFELASFPLDVYFWFPIILKAP